MNRISETFDAITEICGKSVRSVSPGSVKMLLDAIFESRRIFIYGSGRSGLVGQLFAVRLVQLGFDVHFIGEMTTPITTRDDLIILLSNTGKTSSVVQTARITGRIGTRVISLTATPDSELARVSDAVILFSLPENTDSLPLGSAFETSAHIFFECLVCEIMERGNIKEEDMRKRHAIWV
ncbi:MAG: SIS domain-containing protein [Candidatus Methanomethylophilaceae archaeon]|nr:SIS domain-containing protein [Candidatus Methanomethylophilaceae archaeon]